MCIGMRAIYTENCRSIVGKYESSKGDYRELSVRQSEHGEAWRTEGFLPGASPASSTTRIPSSGALWSPHIV